jgi:hypothetical protein
MHPEGEGCAFNCPEPLITATEYDVMTIMLSVMGWVSLVATAFLALYVHNLFAIAFSLNKLLQCYTDVISWILKSELFPQVMKTDYSHHFTTFNMCFLSIILVLYHLYYVFILYMVSGKHGRSSRCVV